MADEKTPRRSRLKPASKLIRAKTNTDSYDITVGRPTAGETDPWKVKTTVDMIECMKRDKNILIDARILCRKKKTHLFETKRIQKREQFINLFQECEKQFRESDPWASDDFRFGGNLIGQDLIPMMGGPFQKQLYMHDYLYMHGLAFHAFHHDPIARAAITIMRDFTLGRGYKVSFDNPEDQAAWDAFDAANKLQQQFQSMAMELSMYGEIMWRFLPKNELYVTYNVAASQKSPTGLIPRVRLMDPSMCWEIVTFPEDIMRVLYYQIVSPTQYQMYTGQDGGKPVPTMKYIWQQIQAEEILHHKINCVSNEKRGRSDLFPVFGYLKRLRDSVNYSIVAMQKASAWAIDTAIEGSQADIDRYIESMNNGNTIPPAGSEFVHTKKIERTYMSNAAAGSKGGGNQAFEWALSMVCAGLRIPINYFGTHLNSGQNKASALVATEPTAKLFEERQQTYIQILTDIKRKAFAQMGRNPEAEMEVTFPDIITQDRSAKLKDLALGEEMSWISRKSAATIAAKELGLDTYDYEEEMKEIGDQKQDDMESAQKMMTDNPLTQPGLDPNAAPTDQKPGQEPKDPKKGGEAEKEQAPADKKTAITSKSKRDARLDATRS